MVLNFQAFTCLIIKSKTVNITISMKRSMIFCQITKISNNKNHVGSI
jgi:hypothetical protein